MRFIRSVKYALRGVVYCINNEPNMRFHTVAAFFTILFSPFFHFSRGEYALLFLTIGSVMAAEMRNSVSEKQSDLLGDARDAGVRSVKDMAAGGVLVHAAFAVGVALCLFARPDCIAQGWLWLAARPWTLGLIGLAAVAAVPYVMWGWPGIRDRLRQFQKKRMARKGAAHDKA